ncbi:MAG: transglycosylase SLT domain-containing protein [Candidatus Hodarchaeales archaeon]|jgi:membrane-bound lytic murein transglycosylase MltF
MKILNYLIIVVFFVILLPGDIPAVHKKLPSSLASHFKKQYTDDLDGLLNKRYIRILTSFNKTNFYISGGKLYGFEYSLMKDYEKYLNKKIKRRDLKVVVELIPVSRDQLIPALIDGFGDVAAAGLTITPERLKVVDVTNPYLTNIDEIIVANKDVGKIETLERLSGRKVYVRQSSSYYESLVSLNEKLLKNKLPPVRIINVDENLETEDILELVNSGAIKVTVADSHIAEIWSRVFENLKVFKHLKVRTDGKIAWMVRKNNPLLKNSLNKFIRKHRKGTRLGNIYFNRYYKDTKWIKDPLTSKENEKFYQYTELFKKYSDKYGFDWMLIMALAFQESGLNNNKKSRAGAVGIMQIKPATASDKKIRINNVHLLENNINAGVKYLDFLKNHYFDSSEMSLKDRVRFTLAAYNAGPAKIQKIRRLARKMGMDPNRWFRNTEFAALKYIGQETVRYVSNINKYYLIFKFAIEKEKLRGSEKRKFIGE